jgi:competence/damage-inducible protein CinA-like protein
MRASIIAVGSELLTPFKVDTNSLLITERLNAIGYDVRMKAVVGDDIDDISQVIERAIADSELVIVTGGLGPTEDDLTRDSVARVLEIPLDVDERIVEALRERFAKRGLRMTDNNRRQAMVPRGAIVLDNPNGSAPGLLLTNGRTEIVLLPGPPRELTPMLDALVRDRLEPRSGGRGLFRRVLRITGRPESEVDALVQPIYSRWTTDPVPISTTILAALGQLELHLTASATSRAEADEALDRAMGLLREALGASVYSTDGRPLEAIVGEMLRDRGLTVAVAESCSGGLLASRLTDVPGSSAYVERGVVCYSRPWRSQRTGCHGDGRRHRVDGEDTGWPCYYRHCRSRRRHARKAGRNGRRRSDGKGGNARAHAQVVRRTRDDQVSVRAGRTQHAAVDAAVNDATVRRARSRRPIARGDCTRADAHPPARRGRHATALD